MKPLRLDEFPLTGIALIEASAGTGKTYSIVRIYLRHVLERGRRGEQIVVASFTNAAADELRQRLRLGLDEALAVAEAVTSEAALATAVAAGEGDPGAIGYLVARAIQRGLEGSTAEALQRACLEVIGRLRLAQLSLDAAPIGTLDAICGRWATEYALDAGISLLARDRSDGKAQLDLAIRNEILFLQGLAPDHPDAILLDHLADLGTSVFNLESWLASMVATGDSAAPVSAGEDPAVRARALAATRSLGDLLAAHPKAFRDAQDSVVPLLKGGGPLEAVLAGLAAPGPLAADTIEVGQQLARAKLLKGWMTAGMRDRAEPAWLEAIAVCRSAWSELIGAPLMAALGRSRDRVRSGLTRIKADQDVVTFDDLTGELRAALGRNPALRARIARDYPVALVDEFQDSSPAQSAIFQHVYEERAESASLVMIGDPKQAIYAFRGGDVFAYLDAGRLAGDNRFRLPANFRSTEPFLESINALFDPGHQPFATDAISYEPVAAGASWARAATTAAAGAPLDVWLLDPGRQRFPGVDAVPPQVVQIVEHHLDPQRHGTFDREEDGTLTPRSARPGDLAILVRTNRAARAIYEELSRLGYPVATRTQDSIFDSAEARELLLILTALVHPTDAGRVRGALATDLLGETLDGLRRQHEDERLEEAELMRFAELRERWDDHGVLSVLYRLITARAATILNRPGGTRCLTNWLQLAELAQAAEERHGSPSRLVRWLRRLVEDAKARVIVGDEHLLRLETDEDAIQVVTLHRCKGLEYPLTILVDPWRSLPHRLAPEALVDPRVGPFRFHDDAGEAQFDLGGTDRPANARQAFREEIQEDIRLAYVGLTRARYRCSLAWSENFNSKLWLNGSQWLFCDPASRSDDGEMPPGAVADRRLRSLADDAAAQVTLSKVREDHRARRWAPPAQDAVPLAARPLGPLPADFWAVTSFSAIKRGLGTDGNAVERLDMDEAARPEGAGGAPSEDPSPPAFQVGSGRSYGNAFHLVMEELLEAPNLDDRSGVELAARQLARYGVGDASGSLARDTLAQARLVLDQPIAVPDDPPVRLSELAPDRRIAEMEFDVPLRRRGTGAVAAVLEAHGHEHAAALLRERRAPLEGLLHGFIDLTFEWRCRYYVLDYKTNWLGERLADYDRAAIDAAMAHSSYDLQYLLYSLAVDRWLRGLNPTYRTAEHFGGVIYLFVRGMHEAGDEGIWFTRPAPELIASLDEVMCPASGSA